MEQTEKDRTNNQNQPLLDELGWLGAGAVLPISSLSFFKRVVKRPPMMALIFLLVFGLVVGVLSAVGVTRGLSSLDEEVRQALVQREFPTITIENGVARADVPQPYTLLEEDRVTIIIDTTGQITRLSRDQYEQGILLTATELHVLNPDGEYNVTDLKDLNLLFGRNTIILNAETLSDIAGGFASIFSVIAFVVLLAWHILVRLIYVSLVSLLIWVLVGSFWKGVQYAEVWIIGAYASVPAVYLTYLLSKANVSICGVQTYLLAMIMLAVAYMVQPKPVEDTEPETGLKLQYAWVGLPMLLVFAYDLTFPLPYAAFILWGVTLATAATLAVLEYVIKPEGA